VGPGPKVLRDAALSTPGRPQWTKRGAPASDGNGLQDRPIYHRRRDSIETHLTIVSRAGGKPLDRGPNRLVNWEIRRYRVIDIQVGPHTITTAARTISARSPERSPAPTDLRTNMTQLGTVRAVTRAPDVASKSDAHVHRSWMGHCDLLHQAGDPRK
jgi:hypothetical protein